jgi:hypothetical protein
LARSSIKTDQKEALQLNLFGSRDSRLEKWVRDLDIASMTPLEALNTLNKLQEYVNADET